MPHRYNAGFTLIELLIVVVILSTLAAIVVPQFASSNDSAKVSAARSSLNGIRSALEMYRADKGEYPDKDNVTKCSTMSAGGDPTASSDIALELALRLYSSADGEVCDTKDATYNQGPYLRVREFPANPLVDGANSINVSDEATLGLEASGSEAWRYQPTTGEFIINDSDYDEY